MQRLLSTTLKTVMCAAVVVALTVMLPLSSRAEEGGSGHYLPGGAASFIDALPGRTSLVAANFFTFYDASASASRPLVLGGQLTLGVDATVFANTSLVLYQTPLKLLGGSYAAGLGIPYVWLEVEGQVTLPGGRSRTVSDSVEGLGDILLYPFMLGWTRGDLKYDVRLGVYMPSGDYNVGQLANLGKNYWTFEPAVSVSWLSSKIGTEVSLFAGFDFSTKNQDTDYQSGNVFHIDGTVAQHLPLLGGIIGVGANWFYYQQISGDSGSGARLGDFEGRTVGIGPALSYVRKLGKTDFAAEVKWLPELDVEKRLQGDFVWFKMGLVF